MEYVIVMDSCGECTAKMKEDERVISAPLTLQVDDHIIIDDDTFDQADFLRKVAESPNCPKSACPSPDYYKEAFEKAAETCLRCDAYRRTERFLQQCNACKRSRSRRTSGASDPYFQIVPVQASVGETLITGEDSGM